MPLRRSTSVRTELLPELDCASLELDHRFHDAVLVVGYQIERGFRFREREAMRNQVRDGGLLFGDQVEGRFDAAALAADIVDRELLAADFFGGEGDRVDFRDADDRERAARSQ